MNDSKGAYAALCQDMVELLVLLAVDVVASL